MALKHLILPLCLVSFQACGAQDSTSRPSLQELKEQYGKTAHAYELHTVGMGLGEAEITPTDPVLVDSELEKVVITYHPPKQGIAPGGKVSICYPPGTALPQLLHKDSTGFVGISTRDGSPVKAEIIRTGWHRITESDPVMNKPYHWRPIFYRVVVAELPQGLPYKSTLTFTWLNTRVDNFARRYYGDRLLFRVIVDHDVDGFAEEIEDSPTIPKIPAKAHRIMWHNATKFGVNQVLMAITLASISGIISRICKIAAFSGDGLVKTLLKLDKVINENAISATLKSLGHSGACKLQMLLLSKNARWLDRN